jgi:hypothetical protein
MTTSETAATTRCFLYGSVDSGSISGSRNRSGVTNVIRLQMDADTSEKCEKMLSSYCRYSILNLQYIPRSLKAYFKDDARKPTNKTEFAIDQKCTISRPTSQDE